MIEVDILTSDKELATICELYWEINDEFEFVHKVAELAELAGVDKFRFSTLVKESCCAHIPDWNCDDCGRPYTFSSRSDFTSKRKYLKDNAYHQHSFVCSDCQKTRREIETRKRKEQEEAARRAKEIADEKMRKKIRETFELSKRPHTDISSLSLRDLVYLYSILIVGAFENLTKIMPVAMFEQPLAPTKEFTSEIVNSLFDNRLIFIHPDTEPEAFVKDDLSRFYTWHVYYAPPVSSKELDNPSVIMQEILWRINEDWHEEWYQEAVELWRRIALEECKEYLLFVLNEHHLEFNPGKKTSQYLEYALQHFSTAQVFNTIWRSAKDAAAYYQRESISKRQAANSAVASIRRIIERAIAEEWEIKPFRRNYKCPQSVLSAAFFNTVLRVGDDGFQISPNIEIVREKRCVKSTPIEDDPNETA